MTTAQAMEYLGKDRRFLENQSKLGKLLPVKKGNSIDWLDQDIFRLKILLDYSVLKEWNWAQTYTVVYCRTEPTEGMPHASRRLEAQKQRMLGYASGRGLAPDLIIGEVRPVLRYGSLASSKSDPNTPIGLQTLFGLIASRKITRLIIETRDRLCALDSWTAFETLLACSGCEIEVVHNIWPSKEQRDEARGWMQDILYRYKVMVGEITDPSTMDLYMKGFDPKLTFLAACKVEAKLLQEEKREKIPRWSNTIKTRRVLDLDECWAP